MSILGHMSIKIFSSATETFAAKDHCGDCIFASFREFPENRANFISKEGDYISAYPRLLHFEYKTVLLAAKKDKMELRIGIEIVMC